jgi:hypothetical protein
MSLRDGARSVPLKQSPVCGDCFAVARYMSPQARKSFPKVTYDRAVHGIRSTTWCERSKTNVEAKLPLSKQCSRDICQSTKDGLSSTINA